MGMGMGPGGWCYRHLLQESDDHNGISPGISLNQFYFSGKNYSNNNIFIGII